MEETLNKIFHAKHWQLFLTVIVLSFLQEIASNVSDLLETLVYIVDVTLYIGWLLLLGNRLRKISVSPQLNYRVFFSVGCTLIAFLAAVKLLGLFKADILKMFDNTAAILSIMAYLLISLIVLTSFVGKNLKAIEVGDDIDINDYFGDVVGLIIWPIGIWTFQPRINKLAERLASR
jgi:hypothetical protein